MEQSRPKPSTLRTDVPSSQHSDKTNLDIFWLRDENLEDSENLPEPEVLAKSIIEDLTAAVEQFKAIAGDLGDVEEMEESIE